MQRLAKFLTCLFAIILTFSSWTPEVKAERVLFFLPFSSKSMANIFDPLATALAQRGHELTIVTPIKFQVKSANVTYHIWYTPEQLLGEFPDPFKFRKENNLFRYPIPALELYCHKVYQNPDFQLILTQKYDLIVANLQLHDCFAGAFYKINAPIVFLATRTMSSKYTELFGNVLPSSFIPMCTNGDISQQMTFLQRTKNFLLNVYFSAHVDYMWFRLEIVYREYLGEEVPSISEIYKKQGSILLQNSHYAITNPRPLMPPIIEIGGIHCTDPKPLPDDLEEFVSGAKEGFIIFSLGSIVKASSMPDSVRLAFLRTFENLKQRVIWKWEKEEGMPDAPQNVKIVKWLPQQSLLGHPKIRLFITHGGLLSTEEAIYHGVPVLGMPVFVDQDSNMRQAEILGIGIKGEILGLTQAKLQPLVRKLLEEPHYMEKAKNLSKIFKDQPQSPLERAVFWTEYSLKHNGAYHLKSAATNLNIFQYHCIDVIFFLTAVVASAILLIYSFLRLLLSCWMLITVNIRLRTIAVPLSVKRTA